MPTATRPRTFDELPVRTRGCCSAVAQPLPEQHAAETAAVLRALADPTRVQMVHILKAATEPVCVCDFNAVFDVGQPTISHHLAKLRDAGLVQSQKLGIWAFYSLSDDLGAVARRAIDLIP